MGALLPLPKLGDVFTDIRGDDRTLRVSRHDDSGVVVVSVWADRHCRASFRLAADEVPRLIAALGAGLDATARPAGPTLSAAPAPPAVTAPPAVNTLFAAPPVVATTSDAAPEGPPSDTTASPSTTADRPTTADRSTAAGRPTGAGLSLLGGAADVTGPGPRTGVSRWWDWARRRAS